MYSIHYIIVITITLILTLIIYYIISYHTYSRRAARVRGGGRVVLTGILLPRIARLASNCSTGNYLSKDKLEQLRLINLSSMRVFPTVSIPFRT